MAVIGARGIGRHHAKWFALEGAEVVACLGTTQATAEKAAETLKELFGFTGRAYSDFERMVAEARPEVLAITCPPAYHLHYLSLGLEASLDCWCEKPLAWDDGRPAGELLGEARRLARDFETRGLTGGVSLQYAAAAEPLLALWRRYRGKEPPLAEFFFHFESQGKRSPDDMGALWVDLGCHTLSLLEALAPGGEVAPESVQIERLAAGIRLTFDWRSLRGTCRTCFELANCEGAPVRKFGFDGLVWTYEGRRKADGTYYAHLASEEGEYECEDFLHTSIKRFLEARRGGKPLVDLTGGVRNLELTAQLYERVSSVSG